jgi:hypothetical protein
MIFIIICICRDSAGFPDHGDNLKDICEAADIDLYQAQLKGRQSCNSLTRAGIYGKERFNYSP